MTNLNFRSALLAAALLAGSTSLYATAEPKDLDYSSAQELKLMVGFPPEADKLVDKSNAIFTPPFNRWSYQNMRTIFPTAEIKNATTASTIKKDIDSNIDTLKVKNPDTQKMENMDTYFKKTFTDSIVVVKGDTVVYEKYFNGMNANKTHQMMSVTKSFAGLIGLMAVEDGKVKESDLVTNYIPELKNKGGFDGATFKQVLNMTNAMDFSEAYADPEADINQYTVVLGLAEEQEGKKYASNLYAYLKTLKKDKAYAHGDIFHYQTPKTDVVNWVTNRATNSSFQDDLSSKLWEKLGTDGDTYVLLDKNGNLFAGGGLNATPNDLARFAMMMLNDGKNVKGEQLISTSIIDKLSKGGNIDAFSNSPDAKGVIGNKDWSYRAQWWVRHTEGKEAFTAIGVNGQWIYINVKKNIAIIRQSSQPVSSHNFYDEFNINAYDEIIAHLTR